MFRGMVELQLEELLKQREKTLYWLASPAGADVEYGSLWRLKEGRAKSISFELLDQICAALNCEPGDLLKRTTEASSEKRLRKKATKKKGDAAK